MERWISVALLGCFAALGTTSLAAGNGSLPAADHFALMQRGKYLVAYGACNDCHTPRWRESDGKTPTSDWMTGSNVGFRGPWGTVYPANVRLRFQQVSEAQWLSMVGTRGGHPPMTWHDLRSLNKGDLRAIYAFIKALGPAGVPAPIGVPPEREPTTPYFDVTPRNAKSAVL